MDGYVLITMVGEHSIDLEVLPRGKVEFMEKKM